MPLGLMLIMAVLMIGWRATVCQHLLQRHMDDVLGLPTPLIGTITAPANCLPFGRPHRSLLTGLATARPTPWPPWAWP